MPDPDHTSATDGNPTRTPPVVTGHELVSRIGVGSYGEVWLARSVLGTGRAVKIVYRGAFKDSRPYEREFAGLSHFEPVSRGHVGLVDILQVDRNDQDGYFYCVMELADEAAAGGGSAKSEQTESNLQNPDSSIQQPASGIPHPPSSTLATSAYQPLTLESRIQAEGRLPVSECLRIATTLADALRYLHDQGLVHRDIKPSNIIFVGGVPKLADVGLVAQAASARTFVGTEGFVPPEGPGTPRADIYSFGKCLYEMAMGEDRQAFPSPPASLENLPDRTELLELNEVIMQACEPDPERRYPSAQAMLADLQLLAAGQSVRRAKERRSLLRWATRIGGLAAICVLIFGLVWAVNQASKPRILLHDNFDASQLDPKRWSLSTREWPGLGNTGQRSFSITQTNGELRLTAHARNEHGYSTFGAAWVDLEMDFRTHGDCLVEVELAGTNDFGWLAIHVTDGAAPMEPCSQAEDAHRVTLLHSASHSWINDRVTMQFLPEQQAVVLYPDSKIREQFEVTDLAQLPQWRLRFYSEANSSAVCSNGLAMLALRRLSVMRQTGHRTIIGRVISDMTGLPIANAIIKDQSGTRVARTLSNGAFKLTPDLWPVRLKAEHPDFFSSEERVLTDTTSRRGPTTIELKKRSYGVGDVVDILSYRDLSVRNIGFLDDRLCALAVAQGKETSESVVIPVDWNARSMSPAIMRWGVGEHPFSSFTQCGRQILAAGAWPGHLYVLGPEHYSLLAQPSHPQDGSPLPWAWSTAYDGVNLWVLERDVAQSRVGLYEFDLPSCKTLRFLRSADKDLHGLAWDGDAQKFWVCNLKGRVYAVNRDEAIRGGSLESGVGRSFPGQYSALAFGGGFLWGLDAEKRHIFKIKITD